MSQQEQSDPDLSTPKRQARQIQFAPSVYEHAARVIDKSPWEVSRSCDLLAAGHVEAFRLYKHCPVVVGIDIYNLEAEAYGAVVEEPAGNGIPAISRPALGSVAELLDLEPFDPRTAGRIPMVIEAAKRVASECPQTDVRIPLSGPFSLAANLIGFESLLCAVYTDPDLVARALLHLVAGQVEFCREVVRNGVDISFFESAATPPLMSPDDFRDIELGALEKIMAETSAVVGHPVPCIMGGDTLPILDYILQTGTGYVCCPAKTDQPKFVERMRAHPEVIVRINMDPAALTSKNFDEVQKEVDRVLTLAENRQNVCIGTGCLPFEADPDVVLKAREYILSGKTPSKEKIKNQNVNIKISESAVGGCCLEKSAKRLRNFASRDLARDKL